MGLFSGSTFEGLFAYLDNPPLADQHPSLQDWAEELFFATIDQGQSSHIVAVLEQLYKLEGIFFTVGMDQPYALTNRMFSTMSQIYGLRMLVAVSQRYGNVPAVRALLDQYYASAAILRRKLDQPYGDALALRQLVEQLWILPADLRARLEQTYAISGEALRRLLAENYRINEYNQLRRQLEQIYLLAPGSATVQQPSINVTADGVNIDCYHISIEIDEGDFAIRGEIHPSTQDGYFSCVHLQTNLLIVVDSTTYNFIVESPRRLKPEVGKEEFVVPFASPTIMLASPYAENLTQEFSGDMASAIVAGLSSVYGINVDWQMVDWFIPSTLLYANNEPPIDIIRKIVSAAGGVIQSSPNGNLICRAEYPNTVTSWNTTAPDYYLTNMDNYFSVDSTPDIRQGFNKFLITDKNLGETGLTIEQRDINSTTKEILVYRVPWSDSIKIFLETSGGSWVSIVDEGVKTETITEQIEIINGSGNVSKPLYSKISNAYKQKDLGLITPSEDGMIQTTTAENSLVEIVYVTKYHLFTVSDPLIEDVQFYPLETEI